MPNNESVIKTNAQKNLENYDLVSETKAAARLMIKQFSQNDVILGATLVDIRTNIGKDIYDKNTNQPLVDSNGNIKRYGDTHYATFDFKGGSIETKISEQQLKDLKVNCDYSCLGRMANVKVFGNTETLPVFHSFIEL